MQHICVTHELRRLALQCRREIEGIRLDPGEFIGVFCRALGRAAMGSAQYGWHSAQPHFTVKRHGAGAQTAAVEWFERLSEVQMFQEDKPEPASNEFATGRDGGGG